MSWREQSICPWVPREIPGQGSGGVAQPSRLAAGPLLLQPACTIPRSAMVPARPRPPPRQRAWPALGCHGPGVQLRPACPLWNNGEACWGVWGRMGGIGVGAWKQLLGGGRGGGRRGSGYSLGGLESPKALGQRSASGVYGGGHWTWGHKIQKMGGRASPFWGQSPPPPAARYLPRSGPGRGGRSGWAERRRGGISSEACLCPIWFRGDWGLPSPSPLAYWP